MSTPSKGTSDLNWRKARKSNPNGACVELADKGGGMVAVRNSRDPNGPTITFARSALAAFLEGARMCEFDDLAQAS